MRSMMIPLVIAAAVGAGASAADEPALSAQIDAIFGEYSEQAAPGCAVAVVVDGEARHVEGYGQANLEHDIAITPDSVFRIASVSKQFTATAIAILAARGEIDLDADVHNYLPELPDYGTPVTVRQMVHHVSGMGDYDGFEASPGKPFRFGAEDYWTIDEFFEQAAQRPLVVPPETEYRYSNLAYFFLSQIVERASGRTLRQFAQDEMFAPLGMTSTFFNDDVTGLVPGRADGYEVAEDGAVRILMTNLSWVGDGGVYTTLNDFLKWDDALRAGRIPGGEAVNAMLFEPHPLTVATMDSGPLDDGAGYAFGRRVGMRDGRAMRDHSGSWVGFRSYYVSFPDDEISAIMLCNRTDGLSSDKLGRLMGVVFAQLTE